METLRDFLVGIGFLADASAAKKAEDFVAKTEAAITKTAAAESAKREGIDQKAATGRLTIAQALGKILILEEQKASEARDRARKAEVDKDEKREQEREKRTRERRETSLKEMQAGALRLAAFALKAVAAVEATALGVVYATDKAAQAMERLNYQSKLIGSTPQSMSAAGYAASQLGSSIDGANQALTSMGLKFKTLPGYAEAFARFTGKSAKDAQGNLRDTGDLVADLGDKLREIEKSGGKYGRANALAQAHFYGIDDQNFINAIEDPRYRQLEQEHRKRQASIGADPNDAAKSGTAFEQSMRRLEDVIEAIKTKVSTGLFKDLQPELEKLSKWGDANGGHIADVLGRIAEDIVAVASAVIDKLSKVDWDSVLSGLENFVKAFNTTATAAFGESGSILVPFLAFGALLTSRVLGPLNLISAALSSLAAIPMPAWFLALTGASAVLTARAAQRSATDMSDPKTVSDPSVGIDSETGLTFHVQKPSADAPQVDTKSGFWGWVKSLYGFGGQSSREKSTQADAPDNRVRDAIISTDKGIKELVEATKHPNDAGGSVETGGGGGASLGDRLAHGKHGLGGGNWKGNYGQKGWWTDERQSHAVDYLMKNAGLTEDGAKALVARWRYVESPGGPTAVNPSSGAEGIAQWLGSRKGSGSGGSFDEQLGKVAKELGGSESRARRLLNTPGQEANGASAYERAEGWNASTNTDNFTGRVREGMRHIVHGGNPTAVAPSPAGTSEHAITEQEAFAAHERLVKGGQNPKDRALYDRWLRQQNTPKPKGSSSGGEDRLDRARSSDAPIKVEVTKPLPGFHAAMAHLRRTGTLHAALHPHLNHPFGVSPGLMASIDNSHRRGNTSVTHNPTFHIHGGDPRVLMADARRDASRGSADLMRNLSTTET